MADEAATTEVTTETTSILEVQKDGVEMRAGEIVVRISDYGSATWYRADENGKEQAITESEASEHLNDYYDAHNVDAADRITTSSMEEGLRGSLTSVDQLTIFNGQLNSFAGDVKLASAPLQSAAGALGSAKGMLGALAKGDIGGFVINLMSGTAALAQGMEGAAKGIQRLHELGYEDLANSLADTFTTLMPSVKSPLRDNVATASVDENKPVATKDPEVTFLGEDGPVVVGVRGDRVPDTVYLEDSTVIGVEGGGDVVVFGGDNQGYLYTQDGVLTHENFLSSVKSSDEQADLIGLDIRNVPIETLQELNVVGVDVDNLDFAEELEVEAVEAVGNAQNARIAAGLIQDDVPQDRVEAIANDRFSDLSEDASESVGSVVEMVSAGEVADASITGDLLGITATAGEAIATGDPLSAIQAVNGAGNVAGNLLGHVVEGDEISIDLEVDGAELQTGLFSAVGNGYRIEGNRLDLLKPPPENSVITSHEFEGYGDIDMQLVVDNIAIDPEAAALLFFVEGAGGEQTDKARSWAGSQRAISSATRSEIEGDTLQDGGMLRPDFTPEVNTGKGSGGMGAA